MAIIKTYEQLNSLLKTELGRVLFILSENVEEFLFEYVQANWYDEYQPTDYQRTYQLLNSIELEQIEETEWRIFFNTDKIKGVKQNGFWQAHISSFGKTEGSLFDGEEFIKEIEDYGNYIHGHSQPLKSIENTAKWIKSIKLLDNGIRTYFRERGADVVISRLTRR